MLARMWSSAKPKLPGPGEALPGRAEKMPVPDKHFVSGARLKPPFPAGQRAGDVRPRLLLGRGEEVLAAAGRVQHRGGLRGRADAQSDLPRGLLGPDRAHRGGAGGVRPEGVSYGELLRVFWEGHDPTQGMRQGNDVGTQYRSAIYTHGDAQRAEATASRDAYAQRAGATAGFGPITTEIVAGAGVLLRRGLPPAVPGEEPRRLLRPRRHRRVVPGRRRRARRPPAELAGNAANSGLRYAEQTTVKKAKHELRAGKSPTTAAGEFVHEEIEHVRQGQTRRALDQAGDRDRAVEGAPRRRSLKPPRRGRTSAQTRRAAATRLRHRPGTRSPRPVAAAEPANLRRLKRDGRGARVARGAFPSRRSGAERGSLASRVYVKSTSKRQASSPQPRMQAVSRTRTGRLKMPATAPATARPRSGTSPLPRDARRRSRCIRGRRRARSTPSHRRLDDAELEGRARARRSRRACRARASARPSPWRARSRRPPRRSSRRTPPGGAGGRGRHPRRSPASGARCAARSPRRSGASRRAAGRAPPQPLDVRLVDAVVGRERQAFSHASSASP